MKKEKKGLLRRINFFLRLIDHEIEKELEKNLRIAFINGFCSFSPKTISLRRNKTHENALYKPCVFTKDKWCSMMPIFVLVSLLFLRFCTKKTQKVRNLRYKGGNYNIRTSFEFVFSPSIYVSTFFIEIEVLAEIMRKSLSAELRHGKLS